MKDSNSHFKVVLRRKHDYKEKWPFFYSSTLLQITFYMMQVTLPPRAARVSQGGGQSWAGRPGRIAFFLPKHRRGSTSFPPPLKPTHLPPTLLFSPYKLTHSSSHPPPRHAKWAEREARAVPGFPREHPPCGRSFTCPFSTPVTCARRRKINRKQKCVATHVAIRPDPRKSDRIAANSRQKGGNVSRSSDFVKSQDRAA